MTMRMAFSYCTAVFTAFTLLLVPFTDAPDGVVAHIEFLANRLVGLTLTS